MTATSRLYTAYGLVIASELELEHLAPGEGPADVTITVGETPASLEGEIVRFADWQALPGRFLIAVAGIGRFLVTDGRSIQVEPAPGVAHDDLVSYLLGSALAALLQQRRILPLHASALQTEFGAILIAATSGTGKSTLAGALQARGLAQMSDDVTGIVFDPAGRAIALSAFPGVRLWPDSVTALGRQNDNSRPVRPGLDKAYLRIENFCAEPQPIRAVIGLEVHNRPDISVTPLPAQDRASWIISHTFRKRFMRGHGLNDFHFQAATALARQVEMIQLRRPSEGSSVDALADRVLGLVQSNRAWAADMEA